MSDARWLTLFWSPERQEISCDGVRFAHPSGTPTSPSHDVAHLLAAAGGLAWLPRGTRDEICTAELHAVLLEHLGVYVLDAILLGRGAIVTALARTLEHARWFVAEHYAPFPTSFDAALSHLASRIDNEAVLRLSAVFFRTRMFELENADYRERTVAASFSSHFEPEVTPLMAPLTRAFGSELARMTA